MTFLLCSGRLSAFVSKNRFFLKIFQGYIVISIISPLPLPPLLRYFSTILTSSFHGFFYLGHWAKAGWKKCNGHLEPVKCTPKYGCTVYISSIYVIFRLCWELDLHPYKFVIFSYWNTMCPGSSYPILYSNLLYKLG